MQQTIGIYFNVTSVDAVSITRQIIEILRDHDIEIYTSDCVLSSCVGVPCLPRDILLEKISMLLVVGGDGTFLQAASIVLDSGTPILGVNRGHLGFLSLLEIEDFEQYLPRIIAGDYTIEKRMTICGELHRYGRMVHKAVGLNDLVINRNPIENTLEFDVHMSDEYIDSYIGDGLIVATSTGSTGYSLSAGGPLIYPGTDCLIVNPICAHILGTSAIIVPADSTIDIQITRCTRGSYLMLDGRNAINIQEGDKVVAYRGDKYINVVQLNKRQYFETVRNKLLNRDYRRTQSRSVNG